MYKSMISYSYTSNYIQYTYMYKSMISYSYTSNYIYYTYSNKCVYINNDFINE